MILLSDLLEAEIVSESGEKVGVVHDVRVERMQRRNADGHRLKVVGLVVGDRGVRERLGLDTARHSISIADRDVVAWERVLAFEPGRIRVR